MSYLIKSFLKRLRKKVLKTQREKVLSEKYFNIIKGLKFKKNIKILDYGSGFEPHIIFNLSKRLKKSSYNSKIICADYYEKKHLINLNKKNNSIQFINLKELKKFNLKFDIVIISDVLHHIDIENFKYIKKILKKLNRNSNYILLKDHFEYGIISRNILRLMDFIGNYYNDVSIPKKYFTKEKLNKLINQVGLKVIKRVENVKIYSDFFLFFANPKYQFIYILK
tara:strand:+ start:929 stop:1600 length:672 start_codon:yes stop_codon:yes gene_type:complete